MTDFENLFKQDIPLIDVRAPIEFNAGHFPQSCNLPLMNDEERRLVGTQYKNSGQAAAIELGHSLVQGQIKASRIAQWTQFISKNPNAKLYCFRGGLRSEISKEWIHSSGQLIEMIPGGYKALRKYLMDVLETQSEQRKFLLLAGRTGSGKTRVLNQASSPFLDLEKHAHHKGSSFGGQGLQPAQITFENRIAVDLLKLPPATRILIEDEAVMIGSLVVPRVLYDQMRASPLLVLERPFEDRLEIIAEEYVIEKTKFFEGDFLQTHAFMVQALNRIQAKLGGLNHRLILKQMNEAFSSPEVGITATHYPGIESLLIHYYDPLYDRSLKKSSERIAFQGDASACLEYLKANAL